MKNNPKVDAAIFKAIHLVLLNGLKKATIFVQRDLTVVVTSIHKFTKRDRQISLCVTLGKPNFANRRLVKTKKVTYAGQVFLKDR